ADKLSARYRYQWCDACLSSHQRGVVVAIGHEEAGGHLTAEEASKDCYRAARVIRWPGDRGAVKKPALRRPRLGCQAPKPITGGLAPSPLYRHPTTTGSGMRRYRISAADRDHQIDPSAQCAFCCNSIAVRRNESKGGRGRAP